MKKSHSYKYYYLPDGTTIALSHFAGKTVKGVAYLKPGDVYNKQTGEKIAAAKCNEKIAGLRYNRATRMHKEAVDAFYAAARVLSNMEDYRDRSYEEWYAAQNDLVALIKSTGWTPQN